MLIWQTKLPQKLLSKRTRQHRVNFRDTNRSFEMHRSPDIRSAPQRQSHLSERPAARLKAKSPATCQILWLTFLPGTHLAALSTGGRRETGGSQTELLEGILTVSFTTANNETGERRSWTCGLPFCFPPIPPPPPSWQREEKTVCVCMRQTIKTEKKKIVSV